MHVQAVHALGRGSRCPLAQHAGAHGAFRSRQGRLADVGRNGRPQPRLQHEGVADQLGREGEEERQVGRRAGLADLRQSGRRQRRRARRHQQRGDEGSGGQGRQGDPDGLPRIGRPVPVAGGPRQAGRRPRQRLAVPGRVLLAARRERDRLLRVQPRRSRGGRHPGLPGQRGERRSRSRTRSRRARPTPTSSGATT